MAADARVLFCWLDDVCMRECTDNVNVLQADYNCVFHGSLGEEKYHLYGRFDAYISSDVRPLCGRRATPSYSLVRFIFEKGRSPSGRVCVCVRVSQAQLASSSRFFASLVATIN